MITAEISLVPVGSRSGTSMSKEIALAFDAISGIKDLNGIKDLKATLTPLGTQIQSNSMVDILNAINIAHEAVKSSGIRRIISIVHIDERLDKEQNLDHKVDSVINKLK
jgi:uncharacterized protein (TIGR00106 family)